MVRAVRYSVSVPSKTLIEDFKRECERRGHTQAFIVSSAMRYFIEHPHQRGWSEKGGDSKHKKKTTVDSA